MGGGFWWGGGKNCRKNGTWRGFGTTENLKRGGVGLRAVSRKKGKGTRNDQRPAGGTRNFRGTGCGDLRNTREG